MFIQPNLLTAILSVTLMGFAGTTIDFSKAVAPNSTKVASTSVVLEDRIWNAEEVDYVPQVLNYEEVTQLIGYPEVAQKAGIQGLVSLRVLVDNEGNYVEHEVISSDHPLLRIPCEVFSSLLTFKPALKDEATVRCWTVVEYSFQIPGYGN